MGGRPRISTISLLSWPAALLHVGWWRYPSTTYTAANRSLLFPPQKMPETAATSQADDRPLSLSRRDYPTASPGGSGTRSSSGGRAGAPSAAAGFEGQLGGYHHAALAAAATMSHHRETSAFVPVVPSRSVHPMLYPGEMHPLLIREKQVRAEGDGRFFWSDFQLMADFCTQKD